MTASNFSIAYNRRQQKDQTATPDKYPQGFFKDKPCRRCGTVFSPNAPSHLYCSQECADDAIVTSYLKKKYDIAIEDYKRMLEEQDHKCGICGGEGFTMAEHHRVKLVVDHDHTTGRVRGLLCHNCNRALGLLHDDVDALNKAIEWIKE